MKPFLRPRFKEGFQAAFTLVEILVAEGDSVEDGQVVAVIDA